MGSQYKLWSQPKQLDFFSFSFRKFHAKHEASFACQMNLQIHLIFARKNEEKLKLKIFGKSISFDYYYFLSRKNNSLWCAPFKPRHAGSFGPNRRS
jgi:hypothetical protein